jgi:membrane protein DedA with SNARE-associated domain
MEFLQGFWEAIRTGNLPDLGNWSYVLIALLVFVEGPSVTLVAGAMAATGILRAEWVVVAAAIGNFSSDQFWYWLGRLGGYYGFLFHFRWFQRRRLEIEQLESSVQEHGVKMYLMAKLSMGLLSIPTLMSAGLAKVSWWRLAGVSVIFEPLWSGFLVFAGLRLGEHITRMERGLQVAALIAGVLLLLAFLWWYRRMFARVNEARNASLSTLNK